MSKIQASTIQKRHLETIKTRKKHDYPSTLTDDMVLQIIDSIKDGLEVPEIAFKIKVIPATLYTWKHRNVKSLSSLWREAEKEYMLSQAERLSKRLMAYESETLQKGKKIVDKALLAIQQREAEYLRSMLTNAKKDYASKDVTVNVQVNLPSPILDIGNITTE